METGQLVTVPPSCNVDKQYVEVMAVANLINYQQKNIAHVRKTVKMVAFAKTWTGSFEIFQLKEAENYAKRARIIKRVVFVKSISESSHRQNKLLEKILSLFECHRLAKNPIDYLDYTHLFL